MKIPKSKKQLILFCMPGFLLGILYTNFLSENMIMYTGILSESFLNQYLYTDVNSGEYIWYVLKERVLPVLIIGALGCTRLKKWIVGIFLAWTGFLGGMMMTLAILKMGVKGLILCLVALTPHVFFYIAVYVILLWYLYNYPDSQWNSVKTVCLILFLSVGILLETYVNPVLMHLFIRTL